MSVIASTNIRYSGSQSGQIKESVLDMLVDTAPLETPLLAMMHRGVKPKGILHQWNDDYSGLYPTTLTELDWRGEGEDASPESIADRVMLGNRTGILGKSFAVSLTQEEVSLFGIESEYRHQAVKKGRQLMRQIEFAIVNSTLDVDSLGPNTGSAGNKRKFGGLVQQIQSASTFVALGGTGGTLPTGAQGYNAAVAATSGALATADITAAQKTVWTRGGAMAPKIVLVNTTAKEEMSKLFSPDPGETTTLYRRYFGVDAQASIDLTVDMIRTDFGDMQLHLCRAVRQGQAIGFDPEWFHLNPLRAMQVYPLAMVGASKMGLIEGEYSVSLLAGNTAWIVTGIVAT